MEMGDFYKHRIPTKYMDIYVVKCFILSDYDAKFMSCLRNDKDISLIEMQDVYMLPGVNRR